MERQPNGISMPDVGAVLNCGICSAIVAPSQFFPFSFFFLKHRFTGLSFLKVPAFTLCSKKYTLVRGAGLCCGSAGEGWSAGYPRHIVGVQSWCIETGGQPRLVKGVEIKELAVLSLQGHRGCAHF